MSKRTTGRIYMSKKRVLEESSTNRPSLSSEKGDDRTQNCKPPPLGSSNSHNVPKPSTKKPKLSKKVKKIASDNDEDEDYDGTPPPDELPEPGQVCSSQQWYSCESMDTLTIVAEKLGISDWKSIAEKKENVDRYGKIGATAKLLRRTLLLIPQDKCSKWKLQGLQKSAAKKKEFTECEECVDCGKTTTDDLLMCDGCDSNHHIHCVGLSLVPETDWFCGPCLQVLTARKNHVEQPLIPALPQLPSATLENYTQKKQLLKQFLQNRRETELKNLTDIHSTAKASWEVRHKELTVRIEEEKKQLETASTSYNNAHNSAMQEAGLRRWSLRGSFTDFIDVRGGISSLFGDVRLLKQQEITPSGYSQRWIDAREKVRQICRSEPRGRLLAEKSRLEKQLKDSRRLFADEGLLHRVFIAREPTERSQIEREYAALLGETHGPFPLREPVPRFLGEMKLQDDDDVAAMDLLRTPDELVIIVPITPGDGRELKPDCCYAIFARALLFDKHRDDGLPWKGVRESQRRLFELLIQNPRNAGVMVRPMSLPNTVRLRTDPKPACFDLSELVNDCSVDLDLPQEPTPKSLAEKGLQLRDYQQSSLRWLLDKEQEESELGLAGELWTRMRFPDDSKEDFYFCELTNSFSLTITDYKTDVRQSDTSEDRFSLATGGFLADEMGLGKTVTSLALIVASPPPPCRRVLPREHLASLAKKCNHPSYMAPPAVGKNKLLSNGTLVVAPMTLLSQWQTEIDRFAPNLSVKILHNDENPKLQAIATADIVLASTFLLQQTTKKTRAKQLLNMVKRIHWHRLICDEAHLSQGQLTRAVLASLSATHRHSVTGTPVGTALSDLFGQLRFLRATPFARHALWKNLVEDPYYNQDVNALGVLRLLLSRIVVRHSKSQTLDCGRALVALPPRTVETIVMPFGTKEEQAVYDALEGRNRKYFMDLQRESNGAVLGKYIELMGMLTAVRQACSHPGLINLEKLQRFNKELHERKRRAAGGQDGGTTTGSVGQFIELAVGKARNSARDKMRGTISRFLRRGYKDLLECPVCLEVVVQEDIALPACAHPVCSTCMEGLLGAGSTTREAFGKCPYCRDRMKGSEVTYLKDAPEQMEPESSEKRGSKDDDCKPPAAAVVSSSSTVSNGFQMKSEVKLCAAGTDASSLRVLQDAITEDDVKKALEEDRTALYTLDQAFLRQWYSAEQKIGTKMARLLQEIQEMVQSSPESKCVVFTLHNSMLDLAETEISSRGIQFVRIDGNKKQYERADALLEFNTNPSVKVFLLSMRSGAVGLTLTSADHCFLLDVAQNSALEEQAIDRIHRIGQTRPVKVKRFIIEGTVEERLLGVRRTLAVDKQTKTGTQLCGARAMDVENNASNPRSKPKKGGKKADDEEDVGDEDRRRHQRFEMLEKLFGCSSATVHKV